MTKKNGIIDNFQERTALKMHSKTFTILRHKREIHIKAKIQIFPDFVIKRLFPLRNRMYSNTSTNA